MANMADVAKCDLLAKFVFDTGENEPYNFWHIWQKITNFGKCPM